MMSKFEYLSISTTYLLYQYNCIHICRPSLMCSFFLLVISSLPNGSPWAVWAPQSPLYTFLRFMDGSIDPRFNWLQDLSVDFRVIGVVGLN